MPKEVVPDKELVSARKEGTALLVPLGSDVADVIITDDHSYALADGVLTRILQAKKNWEGRVDPIIKPIYDGLQLLYSLKRDVLKPLETYEAVIKGKMKAYKLLEAKRIRDEEEARAAEVQRLEEEARAKELSSAKAKTQQMRDRLDTARAEAEQRAAELATAPPPAPIKVAGSSARAKKVPKVVDAAALAEAILDGQVSILDAGEPIKVEILNLFSINTSELIAAYRLDPTSVSKWPGIEIIDDVVIAGQRR